MIQYYADNDAKLYLYLFYNFFYLSTTNLLFKFLNIWLLKKHCSALSVHVY